jgi:hypothetical protein
MYHAYRLHNNLIIEGASVHDWCYPQSPLVKRSQALRRRNLTRDSQADGALIVHQASGNESCQRLFCLSNTGAMPQKIPGSGAEPRNVVSLIDFLLCFKSSFHSAFNIALRLSTPH